jgi:WD40 repeat protein
MRDLFKADYEKPMAEFPEFKGRIFDAVLSRRGDLLVIVGETAKETNVVRVFDSLTGRRLCALPNTGNIGNDWLVTDPQTSRIGCWLSRSNQTAFFNMPDGKVWRTFPQQVNALSPDGRWLSKPADRGQGVTVFSADNPAKQLTIGLDYAGAAWPRFSPNGRLLAFGTPEGTVLVCDLEETIARMQKLGLGWR